jgi:hypothetical protein
MLTVAHSAEADEPESISLHGLAIQIAHHAQLAEAAAKHGDDTAARDYLEHVRSLLAAAHLRRAH